MGAIVPVLVTAVGISCSADLPTIGNDGDITVECTPHADLLIAYTPPGSEEPSSEGEKTLGAPDSDAITLSTNGSLTVAFVGLGSIVNGDGADILVHATGVEGTVVNAYASATGGDDFEYIGELSGSIPGVGELDLATGSVSAATYVRLIGAGETLSVDAFESVSTLCTNQFAP